MKFKFAVLGDDPAMLSVARSIIESAEHQLTHAVAPPESFAAELLANAPSITIVNGWEELLGIADLDAVLVGGHDENVLTGAKQLAAAGKSLLLFPDNRQDSAWIYELTLIRDDNHTVLLPVFPLRDEPELSRMQSLIEAGRIGKVLHLQMERQIPVEETSGATPMLSTTQINADLLFDVDLLRCVGGDYNRITALHSGGVDGKAALATVTLAGTDVIEASWTARPVTTDASWLLHVVGDKGKLELSQRLDGESSALSLAGEGVGSDDDASSAACVLSRLESATNGETVSPDWTDLTRDVELVDATARSIRRRRTIDLHFETTSERNQFKTQMTAIGCGLISMTLVSVVFLLAFNAMFPVHQAVMQVARIGVFVPLGLFLVLQLLLFVSRPSAKADG